MYISNDFTLTLQTNGTGSPWRTNIMDPPALLGVKLLVSLAAGLFGLVFNSWIVHVNVKDRRRGSHLSLPDQILTFTALINIVLQAVLCFDMTSIQTKYYMSFDQIHLSCIRFMIFLTFSNVWLTTWLSVYYCMRIVNFTGVILLSCKTRISRLLPKLLVVSTAVSFILALPSFWNIRPVIVNSTLNHTEDQNSISITSSYLIAASLGCILPLVLTLLPIGLTLSSVWRHMNRMTKNKPDSFHPRTEAHGRAARTMVLLVSVHTGLLLAAVYVLSKTFNFDEILMFFCWYFTLFYPTVQAFVLITGNAKLRKASKELFFSWLTACHVTSETEKDPSMV